MEGDAVTLTQDIALGLWAQLELFLRSLLRPWNAYQIANAVGLFGLAHVINALLGPICREWKRQREGWPAGSGEVPEAARIADAVRAIAVHQTPSGTQEGAG